jgi:hypothetical protein
MRVVLCEQQKVHCLMKPAREELARVSLARSLMKRTPLDSSCLASAGYDRRDHVLEIEFRNGGLYQYLDVPSWEHQRLLDADSHGTYFNAHIRNRYPFQVIRRPRNGS